MNLMKLIAAHLPADTINKIATLAVGTAAAEFETAKAHMREANMQAERAEYERNRVLISMRPSRTYPVSLTHDGVMWTCRLSTSNDPLSDLTGRGEHPENAMTDFDNKWFGANQ